MQASAPAAAAGSWRARLLEIAGIIALVGATVGFVAWVWYPTTLQPDVTLTDVSYTATPCAPVLDGYANQYDLAFTLVNAGRADGYAAV